MKNLVNYFWNNEAACLDKDFNRFLLSDWTGVVVVYIGHEDEEGNVTDFPMEQFSSWEEGQQMMDTLEALFPHVPQYIR